MSLLRGLIIRSMLNFCVLRWKSFGERLIGFYEYLSLPTTWAWQITIFVVLAEKISGSL